MEALDTLFARHEVAFQNCIFTYGGRKILSVDVLVLNVYLEIHDKYNKLTASTTVPGSIGLHFHFNSTFLLWCLSSEWFFDIMLFLMWISPSWLPFCEERGTHLPQVQPPPGQVIGRWSIGLVWHLAGTNQLFFTW